MRISFAFDSGKSEKRGTTVSNWWSQFKTAIGLNAVGSTAVNTTTAMGLSSVFRAVHLKASTFGSLSKDVIIRESVNGRIRKNVDVDSTVQYLIHDEPNAKMSAYTFWYLVSANIDLWGEAFAYIVTNPVTGRIEAFDYWHPNDVDVTVYDDRLWYKHRKMTEWVSSDDVLHWMEYSVDGVRGVSKIALHRITLATGLTATSFQNKFFENGAMLNGYLVTDQRLTDPQRTTIAEQWKSRSSGENAFGTPVLDGGLKFNALNMPLRDAQFVELQGFTVGEVSRIFGVPLHKLGIMDGAKFNNVEQQNIEWVVDGIRPMAVNIESEFKRKVFGQVDRKRTMRINLESLLRGDIKTRSEFYKTMYYIGAWSPNDIRDREGDNARDGGNEYFNPANMISQRQLEESIKAMEQQNDGGDE